MNEWMKLHTAAAAVLLWSSECMYVQSCQEGTTNRCFKWIKVTGHYCNGYITPQGSVLVRVWPGVIKKKQIYIANTIIIVPNLAKTVGRLGLLTCVSSCTPTRGPPPHQNSHRLTIWVTVFFVSRWTLGKHTLALTPYWTQCATRIRMTKYIEYINPRRNVGYIACVIE